MAINNSYPEIEALASGDLLLVSDISQNNSTKSVKIQTLANYIGSGGGGEGSGTVTSVDAIAGTGISVSGVPITTSGTITITNTAPNVTTNLSSQLTSTTVRINSSDGNDVTIDGATSSYAGVMTAADKTKLDDISIFKNFAVDGQTTVVADSISDTLTLVAGDNITIATDSALDTITISALSTLNNNFADDIIVNGVIVGAGSNVNADENTRVGALSLGQSSGNFNTAVGWSALRYNTTGQYNTAIGNASMSQYIISGSSNVGVGYRSLRAVSNGIGNVAVGSLALTAISGGGSNVAIGTNALDLLVNSNGNVGIGTNSLGGLATGGGNVAIGYHAGGINRNSLNDSVFIGNGSSSNSDGQTNQIVIGATAVGNGSNTATIGNSDITELHVGGNGAGLVLKSPNGTAYKIIVSDAGAITATAV